MTARQPTLAEVAERVEELRGDISRLPADIAGVYVRKDLYEAKHQALRDQLAIQLAAIKQTADSSLVWSKWAVALIATAVVGAVVAFIQAGGS